MAAVGEGIARGRRSAAFIALVGLANAGGVIAFLPLLSLLLPGKIEAIAGEARIGLLTATVIAGAVVASGSSILFGWLSDRSVAKGRGRRGWALGGLIGLAASFALVALAHTHWQIVVAIMVFQFAVNAVLAPLFAIMADEVPGAQMGVAGGLIALGNPLASAVVALMIGIGVSGEPAQLAFVFAATALCVVPLLATRAQPAHNAPKPDEQPLLGRDLAVAWTSRLLVQIAGSVLFFYVVYYFDSVDPAQATGAKVGRLGHLMTIAYLLPLPVALLIGRWSDRIGQRKPFLLATGLIAVAGLAGLALATSWWPAAFAFALYAMGSACFLALHSGFAMQLLPRAEHRGRDLGVLNLTNTLPSLIGPVLTWWLASPRDFHAVMAILAVLTLIGSVTILAVRGRR